MSISRDLMLELMAYADGELEAKEIPRVEALLERDEEARQLVSAMAGSDVFGALLSPSFDAAAESAAVDAIADAVMARVAVETMQPKVTSLNAARAKRDRRVGLGVTLAAVAALAASVFFFVRSQPASSIQGAQVATANANPPSTITAPIPTSPKGAVAAADPGERQEGIQVDEVDTPSQDVSVYYVRGGGPAKSQGSVVIWVGQQGPSGLAGALGTPGTPGKSGGNK